MKNENSFFIIKLREAVEQREKYKRVINGIMKNTLDDTSLIPTLHEWFKEVYVLSENENKFIAARDHFIFVVLLFYSPGPLLNYGCMKRGVRKKIAETLGLKSPSTLSNILPNLYFWWEKYPEFKKKTKEIFYLLKKRLETKGVYVDFD